MLNCTQNCSPRYIVGAKQEYGKTVPNFYPVDLLSRNPMPNDNMVTFEKTSSPNEFKIHVVSGNPDEIAKCLDIQA